MAVFPKAIEGLIQVRVRKLLTSHEKGPLSGRELQRLSAKVLELSDYFTKKRYDRPDNYLSNKGLMAAYMAYFLPSNILKIEKPLRELMLHPMIRERMCGKISILDLGCGPGTASLGFLNFLAEGNIHPGTESSIEITLADSVRANLKEAGFMVRRIWDDFSDLLLERNIVALDLETVLFDIESRGGGTEGMYDLIVLSNSLGEIGGGDNRVAIRSDLIGDLAEKNLKESGSLIIIEPALRDSSRDLLVLREEILERGALNVYSPCIAGGRCGALDSERDWCHEADEWEPPRIVRDIDRETGFSKTRLNYSYLVLRKDGHSLADLPGIGKGDRFRVVSDLLSMKGDRRAYLCGKRGRIQAGRLDRNISGSNSQFDRVKRGDIIEVRGLQKKGEILRVGKDGHVRLWEEANGPP